jgi:hypothetical protein
MPSNAATVESVLSAFNQQLAFVVEPQALDDGKRLQVRHESESNHLPKP